MRSETDKYVLPMEYTSSSSKSEVTPPPPPPFRHLAFIPDAHCEPGQRRAGGCAAHMLALDVTRCCPTPNCLPPASLRALVPSEPLICGLHTRDWMQAVWMPAPHPPYCFGASSSVPPFTDHLAPLVASNIVMKCLGRLARLRGLRQAPGSVKRRCGALQRILICGWGETAFMASILRELDHGPAALPRGSEVVLFNQRDPPWELPQVKRIPRPFLWRCCCVAVSGHTLPPQSLQVRELRGWRYRASSGQCSCSVIGRTSTSHIPGPLDGLLFCGFGANNLAGVPSGSASCILGCSLGPNLQPWGLRVSGLRGFGASGAPDNALKGVTEPAATCAGS